ncbi:hypothetical protein FOA52_003965 [Chlamydomonas sp. UWO 241]|nr:hypothetical protein FOA52_003965 [Chlamydomonas sp. UWO 241]
MGSVLANAPGMPDLQARMSKKIAALTTVIHNLHNKTDDVDLQEVAAQYEGEIEQILRDTAVKVNMFKNQLEGESDGKRIKAVEAQLEEERRRHVAELDTVRKRAAEKEAAIQKAAVNQTEKLMQQVDGLTDRLAALTVEADELRARARGEAESAAQAARALKAAEEAVAAAERLAQSLQASVDGAAAAAAAARAEAEAAFGRERAGWETERARAVAALKSKVDALAADVAREARRCSIRAHTHTRQVEALTADVTREARRAADASAVAAAERDAGATRAAQLQAALHEAEDAADDLEVQVAAQAREMELLKGRLRAAEAGAEVDDIVSSALPSDDGTQLRAANADLAAKLASAEAALADTSLSGAAGEAAVSLAAARAEAARMAAELEAAERELRAARDAGDAAERRAREAAARVAAAEDDARAARAAMSAAADGAAAAAQARAQAEGRAAARADAAGAGGASDARALEQEARTAEELAELRARLEREKNDALEALRIVHASELEVVGAALSREKLALAEARQALADAKSSSAAAAPGPKARAAPEDAARADALAAQLGAESAGRTEAEAAVRALQAELDAAAKRKGADERKAKEAAATEFARLDKEYGGRLAAAEKAAKDAAAKFACDSDALRKRHVRELEGLGSRLREEAARAAKGAADEAEGARRKAAKALEASERKAAEGLEGERRKAAFDAEVKEREQAKALADAEAAAAARVARAAAAGNETARASLAALRKEAEEALRKQRATHEKELTDLSARHTKEVETLKASAAAERDAAAATAARARAADAARAAQLEGELRELQVTRLQTATDDAMSSLLVDGSSGSAGRQQQQLPIPAAAQAGSVHLEAALAESERASADARAARDAAVSEASSLRRRLEALSSGVAGAKADAAASLFRLKQEHAGDKSRALASFAAEREGMVAEHRAALAELSSQLRAARNAAAGATAAAEAKAAARYAALERSYDDLLLRHEGREARMIDLLRIKDLEMELVEAHERLRLAADRASGGGGSELWGVGGGSSSGESATTSGLFSRSPARLGSAGEPGGRSGSPAGGGMPGVAPRRLGTASGTRPTLESLSLDSPSRRPGHAAASHGTRPPRPL